MLFCDETFDLYRTDPGRLLSSYDLEKAALFSLPDPDAPQLAAERQAAKPVWSTMSAGFSPGPIPTW